VEKCILKGCPEGKNKTKKVRGRCPWVRNEKGAESEEQEKTGGQEKEKTNGEGKGGHRGTKWKKHPRDAEGVKKPDHGFDKKSLRIESKQTGGHSGGSRGGGGGFKKWKTDQSSGSKLSKES